MLLLCLSCLDSRINASYKNSVATNTTHHFSIVETTHLYISPLCDGKKLKGGGDITLCRVLKCSDKGWHLGSACLVLWFNCMKMPKCIVWLQSSLAKLIHCALFIFYNPDIKPWSILHLELFENKVALEIFFLVDLEYKSDFYGNHRFFQYGISHITPFILNRQIVLYRRMRTTGAKQKLY